MYNLRLVVDNNMQDVQLCGSKLQKSQNHFYESWIECAVYQLIARQILNVLSIVQHIPITSEHSFAVIINLFTKIFRPTFSLKKMSIRMTSKIKSETTNRLFLMVNNNHYKNPTQISDFINQHQLFLLWNTSGAFQMCWDETFHNSGSTRSQYAENCCRLDHKI